MRIGYARVSTRDQNLDMQVAALRKAGCNLIYMEKVSGIKQRPELERCLNALRPDDTLVVFKLDRIGRSQKNLVDIIDDLNKRGIGLVSIKDNIDASTSGGKLVLHNYSIPQDFATFNSMKDRILLEEMPLGTSFLDDIIESMQKNTELRIDYQRYEGEQGEEHLQTFHIQPYALKVFNRRWYLLGFIKEKDGLRIIALDRILGLKVLTKSFTLLEDFDARKYFSNVVGIFVNKDLPITKVKIRAYGIQADYLRSTPLHKSQSEGRSKHGEFAEFTYRLCITQELISQLLAMGDKVEVLKPKSLREKMNVEVEKMKGRYKYHFLKCICDMSEKLRETVRKELITKRNYTQFKNYKFYVNDLSENLIGGEMSDEHRKMFDDASGSELNDIIAPAKAKAIDSSSMLSYNFFRHISEDYPIEIDNIRYNKVIFEVRLRTLKASPLPANIDVALISEDKKTVLFIESKFLEYLGKKSDILSESYSIRMKYFDDNGEVEDILAMPKYFKDNFTNFIYKYGIKQNICHLVGISNLSQSKQAKGWFKRTYKNSSAMAILNADSYRFMNMIFRPSNEEAEKICDTYIKQLQDFKDSLPETIKKYISPTFIMKYGELYEKLPYENDIKDELQKRYINFHS